MDSRSRASVVGAATAAAVVCTFALAGGPSARADALPQDPPAPSDTITITSPATVTALGGQGGETLAVTANSTTALASMTVHLDDATTGTDTLDLTMTAPAGGAQPGASTWTSGTLTTANLPLGSYFITVDAADTGGTSVTGVPAGTLPFQVTPQITPGNSSTVLSYTNQHPVIAGTVTELAPGATQATPYAGQPLVLHDPVEGDIHLTTSAAGGYSAALPHPAAGETITAEVLATPTTASAAAAPVTLTAQPSQLRLSAKLSAAKVRYGAKVTISGTVGYASGHSVMPLAGQQVHISAGGGHPSLTATTDKSGRFTAALPKQAESTDWIVRAGGGQFLTSVAATLPMTVELPTAITGFRATLNQYWQVNLRGCLGLAPKTPGYLPSLKGLVIQYSPGPHGPWHALGAVPAQKSTLCGNGGRTFSATFTARRNYAYYRASFGGSNTSLDGVSHDPATGFLSSLSASKLAWKYADRFDDVKFAPHSVHKGGKLTVTGKLETYTGGKWRPLTHQVVQIILKPKGSSGWYWIVKVNTGGRGGFSATFTDPVTATWSTEYLGDAKHLATVGPMVSVTLKD
jgi:hypothetical protein